MSAQGSFFTKFLAVTGLAAGALLVSAPASAHTIALGTVNAGAPGSVTIWLGSYHTGAGNEGSLTLNGVTQAFNQISAVLPAGLVAGDNYFYAQPACCLSPAGQFDQLTNLTGLAVTAWQGVTFTGLAAGIYTYSITGMFSVDWADWNSNTSNWTGRLVIPESSVGVPEPGTLALLGLGLFGLGLMRRRAS
ncbi:MAG: PEP-CTERM sorting domain-containing protein [Steroidobacteraceae bacterium]